MGALPLVQPAVHATEKATEGHEGARSTASVPKKGERFAFALLGDMPYTRKQEGEYAAVLEDLNEEDLVFAVHVGDTMFDPRPYERNPSIARQPGAKDNYEYVLGTFNSCNHPLISVPGDNDWSDYVEFKEIKADPFECLATVRAMFFPEGRSLGKRQMPVQSQRNDPAHAEYVENQMWDLGGVTFATMHVLGSNDNFERTPELEAERKRRMAANLAWMDKAFEHARDHDSQGLVLIIHANPGFENHWPPSYLGRYFRLFGGVKTPNPPAPTPYDEWVTRLRTHMESWDRPTALLHGDTHLFRIDKPLFGLKSNRPFENLTRVETFGWPDTHWVKITVDPDRPELFIIEPQIVSANLLKHGAS